MFHLKWNAARDVPATVIGAASGGIGLIGVYAKKALIAADDPWTKKAVALLGTAVLTAGTGIIPFLLARPGQTSNAEELRTARDEAAKNRYG